ncbi:MAG: tRNA (adenosine(37)-N6)-dimethylallyltransferase MiaA [Clostridia bacterium]|nr:tRNA (adenosine(37)-N6)-dimethylallyltransferase MiaA [Clostridia bacterium]
MTTILSISGPTASGKSALSVAVAKSLRDKGAGAQIVSCDSMQIYKKMNIGTGKITDEEMGGVPHHLLDILDPSECCSLADFTVLAHGAIDRVTEAGDLPILCGGTGLYLDNILFDTTLSDAPSDEALRAELEEADSEELHRRLREVDPESGEAIHQNNRKRVIRALEIYLLTGRTKSDWDACSRIKKSRYNAKRVHLVCNDRSYLYERINKRVDEMFAAGLEEEARTLFSAPLSKTAAGAIGYKEFLPYFRGECTLEEVREQVKQASRNYAKRQLTWFKRQQEGALILDCALPLDEKCAQIFDFLEGEG